jgi:hypothetical protein
MGRIGITELLVIALIGAVPLVVAAVVVIALVMGKKKQP